MTHQAIDAPDPTPRDDVALPDSMLHDTVPMADFLAARRRAPGLCPHAALAVHAEHGRRAADLRARTIATERDLARGEGEAMARRVIAAEALAEERRRVALRMSDSLDHQNDYIVTLQRRCRTLLTEARWRRVDWFAYGTAAGAVVVSLVRIVTGGW